MSNILLVTGATGFLGAEILRQAVSAGMRVRATARHPTPTSPDFEYISADLLHPQSLGRAINDSHDVIHAAGLAHVFKPSKLSTATLREVNEIGTTNIVREAVRAGVRHFILVSSVSVYGHHCTNCDETTLCKPENNYAESKWQAEQRAIELVEGTDTALTILRMAMVYGEEDPGNMARLIRAIDRRRFFWIGSGKNQKSLIYRQDAARACLAALLQTSKGINVYNVSAPPTPMSHIVECISSALGQSIPRWKVPASLALSVSGMASYLVKKRGPFGALDCTIRKWLADDVYDGTKFQSAFDFQPSISLKEGLHREVAWYRQQSH
jgi:nucleoside-diphosphate-sugar epimerase